MPRARSDNQEPTAATTRPKRSTMETAMQPLSCVLLTGFPGFIGGCLARRILAEHPAAELYLLIEEPQFARAEEIVRAWPAGFQARTHLWLGDVAKMDLGLSGIEIEVLAQKVTHVFHLAALQSAHATRDELNRVNVEGTRNVIDLAKELPHLVRLVHFSTCYVSGDRVGVITEDELDEGQGFRNGYERSKFRAEKLVRAAMNTLPVTVLRPSIVIGDSATGEIDRFDGIYGMGILVVTSPISVPLPLPGTGSAPLHLVPVDFVTRAALALASDPRAEGGTFHVVDPSPLSSRHVYELIAARAGRKLPRVTLRYSLAKRLLRVPGVERVSRVQADAVDHLNHFAIYHCAHTLALLEGTGIVCPRFETYVDNVMRFVSESLRQRTRRPRPRLGHAAPLDQ